MAQNNVKQIPDDKEFLKAIEKSITEKSKLLIDFNATWCAPCKAIAPIFSQLAAKYQEISFLSVDIDKCKGIAVGLDVREVPTFHFYYAGTLIKAVKGANKDLLEQSVDEFAQMTPETLTNKINQQTESLKDGDLVEQIDFTKSECLNDEKENPWTNAFKADDKIVKSDTDEQLLFNISFKKQVHLKTLKIIAPSDGSGPKKLKLFLNKINFGFSEAEDDPAVQEVTLTPKDLVKDTEPLKLNALKFMKVNSLSIFVASNQEGEEQTQIEQIIFFGKPS
eukprot:TRINITY_DN912_c0_g1_i1.p1 TRINITY_DN912_c0_g1~~TRINITY_DN912_c0_g1_i1.p1  ORF type:complete len:279 (-),score=64.43 TRINITY_DN912_c0_g1_i1:95-931(-)